MLSIVCAEQRTCGAATWHANSFEQYHVLQEPSLTRREQPLAPQPRRHLTGSQAQPRRARAQVGHWLASCTAFTRKLNAKPAKRPRASARRPTCAPSETAAVSISWSGHGRNCARNWPHEALPGAILLLEAARVDRSVCLSCFHSHHSITAKDLSTPNRP